MVECLPSKQVVRSSNPLTRSKCSLIATRSWQQGPAKSGPRFQPMEVQQPSAGWPTAACVIILILSALALIALIIWHDSVLVDADTQRLKMYYAAPRVLMPREINVDGLASKR